jgi:hypothetical protein
MSTDTSDLIVLNCLGNLVSSEASSPNKGYLLGIVDSIIPSLPTKLFNTLSIPFELDSLLPIGRELDLMLNMFYREFINDNLQPYEHMFLYVYLEHAYEETNNQDLKPLLDYFKPTKNSIRDAWAAFSSVRFHCAEYLPAGTEYIPIDILEMHGFDSLKEVDDVLENAFRYGQKENGLERLNNVRGYIKDALTRCYFLIDLVILKYPYINLCCIFRSLLLYIDFILRKETLIRFKEMYYALKYKHHFRHLLWVKVREPKIRAKYHPDNLAKLLEEHGEINDVDELEKLLTEW